MGKVAIFSSQNYEKEFYGKWQDFADLTWFEARLDKRTARLAEGHEAVSLFVEDQVCRETLDILQKGGVKLLLLRCAGFNNVDISAAGQLGIMVARVPSYSPHAIAEHTVGLMLSLARRLPQAFARSRELNFSLNHLLGFELHQKTIGVVGTGHIGAVLCQILSGFGCKVLAADLTESSALKSLGVEYVDVGKIYESADIISLHVPLTPETKHMISSRQIASMKKGVILVNTSRGGLIETQALIDGLKRKQVAAAALDVYEEEEGVFFHDLSADLLEDDVLARLLTFPNVIITSHQAFFTREALTQIAATTIENYRQWKAGETIENQVKE